MKTVFLILGLIIATSQAWAERYINVNGEQLDEQTALMMDSLFGYSVPDGFYWLNTQTGEWGYENEDEVQGIISAISQYNQNNSNQPNQYYSDDNYYTDDSYQQPNSYQQQEFYQSQNGSAVSGQLNGQNCTFVSVGGTTMKSCD